MITKIKKALGVTNQELVKKGIHKSQISRWNKSGFHSSTKTLLSLLIDEIDRLKTGA